MGRKPGRGTGAEVTSYEASCPPQASACPRGTAARRVQPCQHPVPGRGISQLSLAAGAPLPAASLLPVQEGTKDVALVQPTGNDPAGQGSLPGLERLGKNVKGP